MRGLYIHVPFCANKCPYCDFYSLKYNADMAGRYTDEVIRRVDLLDESFDTVYFGGGTPSLLGASSLCRILSHVSVSENCEIALEANPTHVDQDFFTAIFTGGFNRLSMGLQSADSGELKVLGRKHDRDHARRAVKAAKAAGFDNISLDLMLGTPEMTRESLLRSIEFCEALSVQHISAYILKIEEGTPFSKMSLNLPDEDLVCELYLFLVDELNKRGYSQYEISNFSLPGFESKHNLKYWLCEEYRAVGPAAHSFANGVRHAFPRDLDYFLSGGKELETDTGGDFQEFVMLGLRLNRGISLKDCTARFTREDFFTLMEKTKKIPSELINAQENKITLTPKGFLLSNQIIGKLLGW